MGTSPRKTSAKAKNFEAKMRRLSYDQALVDLEVANGRVLDLMERLSTSDRRILELDVTIEDANAAYADTVRRADAIRASAEFRLASRIWNIRNLIGR